MALLKIQNYMLGLVIESLSYLHDIIYNTELLIIIIGSDYFIFIFMGGGRRKIFHKNSGPNFPEK